MAALRQFYLSGLPSWSSSLHLFDDESGSSYVHLLGYSNTAAAESLYSTNLAGWQALPEVQAWIQAGSPVLVSAGISREESANAWRSLPDVATLQHSVYESSVPFSALLTMPYKQFTGKHLALLTTCFGIQASHTVWDLHGAVTGAKKLLPVQASPSPNATSYPVHPGVRLSLPF